MPARKVACERCPAQQESNRSLNCGNKYFHQDNDPYNKASIVPRLLEKPDSYFILQSPDLNPIEDMWDEIERDNWIHYHPTCRHWTRQFIGYGLRFLIESVNIL
ncbi:hypothetical protein TNCV_2411741 [Trichonephila clavipes]|nr:hypothetical protein TNCV_2411741 [Trichonephila clavipes]